jgi:two-component system cell cycle sensor histidine kinase PleC
LLIVVPAAILVTGLAFAWRRALQRQAMVRRFFEFTENSADWMWEVDADLRVTYLSGRYAEVTGVNPANTISKSVADISKMAEDKEWLKLGDVMATRQPFRDFSYKFTRRDGAVRQFLLSGKPLFDRHGVFRGYCGAGSDITQLHEAQERQMLHEAHFRALFEQAPNPMGLADLDGRFYLTNAAFTQLLGHTSEELTALGSPKITHPDDREISRQFLERVGEKGFGTLEKRYLAKDGRTVFGRLYASTLKGSSGQSLGLIGQLVDLTPMRESNERLLRSESEFRAIFEQAPNPIVLVGPDGQFIKPNAAFARFLGYTIEELKKLKSADVTHAEDIDANHQCYQLASQDGFASIEKRYIAKDGRILHGIVHFVKISDRQDRENPITMVAQIIDVTAIRRAETEMREAMLAAESHNRSKSQFLANMSHELRTPLNAVIGFAQILESQLFGPLGAAKYRDYATDIRTSGEHLLSLINDILDLARVEAGKLTLEIESISLAKEIESCLRVVQLQVMKGGLEIGQELQDAPAQIQADRRAFKQIVINLFSNAIKFTPPGGAITIAAKTKGDMLELKVSDTGIGIPTGDLSRLGRPFEQVSSTLNRSHEGSGLGLALCHSLVHMHGGKFFIESVQGKGTTVTATFPLLQMGADPGDKPSMAQDQITAAQSATVR